MWQHINKSPESDMEDFSIGDTRYKAVESTRATECNGCAFFVNGRQTLCNIPSNSPVPSCWGDGKEWIFIEASKTLQKQEQDASSQGYSLVGEKTARMQALANVELIFQIGETMNIYQQAALQQRIAELEAENARLRMGVIAVAEKQECLEEFSYKDFLACVRELGYSGGREYIEAMATKCSVEVEEARVSFLACGYDEWNTGFIDALMEMSKGE